MFDQNHRGLNRRSLMRRRFQRLQSLVPRQEISVSSKPLMVPDKVEQISNSNFPCFRCFGFGHLSRNCLLPFHCEAYFAYGHKGHQCSAQQKKACQRWVVKGNLVGKESNKAQSPSLPPPSRPVSARAKNPNPISPSNLPKQSSSMANININPVHFLDVGHYLQDGSPNGLPRADLMVHTPCRLGWKRAKLSLARLGS